MCGVSAVGELVIKLQQNVCVVSAGDENIFIRASVTAAFALCNTPRYFSKNAVASRPLPK